MKKPLEAYDTPIQMTKILLKHVTIRGEVFECCSGRFAISDCLKQKKINVITNDVDPYVDSDHHFDATRKNNWSQKYDWVVTNPPFSQAAKILPLAFQHSRTGVAMLLRLSFLEPCANREAFLSKHPPNIILVLPRCSFTGDKKTDTVTCAWIVWFCFHPENMTKMIKVITKKEVQACM